MIEIPKDEPNPTIPPGSWRILLTVTAVTGLMEMAVMFQLDAAGRLGLDLPFWLEAALDTAVMAATAALLFWFVWVKQLYRQLSEEKRRVWHEQRFNADLKRALDEHALVSITDVTGKIIFANEKFCDVSGYDQEELLGQDHRIVNSGHHDGHYIKVMWQSIAQGRIWQGEFRNRRKDGGYYWVDTTITPFLNDRGKPYQYVAIRRDITELKETQARAQALGDRLKHLIDASPSVIYAHENPSNLRQCTYISGNVRSAVGYSPDSMLAKHDFWLDHLHPDDRASAAGYMKQLLEEGQATLEYRFLAADGDYRWIFDNMRVILDELGVARAIVGSWTDITARRRMEEKLISLATHDELTDLPNRTLLQDRMGLAIAQAVHSGDRVAILFIDLDRFKNINESLGHDIGDAVLRTAAGRLRGCVREVDTVARYGADEFIAVLTQVTRTEDITVVADKVLAALSLPYEVHSHELFVTASIGISVYPKDGEDVKALVKNADAAMHRAKDGGRNRFEFYAEEMNAVAVRRLFIENQMRLALERREFVVYYQPQADLEQGRIVGVEALVRWNHPEKGVISPGEFIEVAEETGLIVPLGEWVLETACRQAAMWQEAGLPKLRMSVNLSGRQLARPDLPETIERVLFNTKLESSLLELELTESMLIENAEASIATLSRLRKMGIRLSVDDFGTGYSALGYLNRFPINTVKIDRSFVTGVTTDPQAAALARSIISMAHELRLRVIAEGAETEGQLSFLTNRHCDEVQGYYLSRPLPADDCARFLREFTGLPCKRQALGNRKERTLLLVDDEPNIVASLKRLVRKEGYQILSATSGREGLELLATHNVGVIISDQRMPEMSGVEFLSRVKELYPATVRIVLSGYTDLKSITDAINEGAIYKFLTKPWEDDALRANILEAFQRYELKQENLALTREIERANNKLAEINRALEQRIEEKTRNLQQSVKVLQISQEILEHLPTAVIGVEETGLIVMANQAAHRMFADEGEPFLGTMAEDRLPAPLSNCIAYAAEHDHYRPVVLPDGSNVRVICHRLGDQSKSKGTVLIVAREEEFNLETGLE